MTHAEYQQKGAGRYSRGKQGGACDSDLFSEYKPTLYESEIASIKQAMCERYIGVEGYEDIISPGGQCLPGIQRFFVTADGKIFSL